MRTEAGYGNQRKPLPHTPDLIGKKGMWIKRTKDKAAYEDLRTQLKRGLLQSRFATRDCRRPLPDSRHTPGAV